MDDNIRAFRDALGCFATGVTVITTLAEDGRPVGLTANSFNSVSLDPPLVLWSLRSASSAIDVFKRAQYFAVNLLSHEQRELSRAFATSGAPDKFAGVETEAGIGGVPLLKECLARFECETDRIYTVGDHELFIGRVVEHRHHGHVMDPLIFCKGRYVDVPPRVEAVMG